MCEELLCFFVSFLLLSLCSVVHMHVTVHVHVYRPTCTCTCITPQEAEQMAFKVIRQGSNLLSSQPIEVA